MNKVYTFNSSNQIYRRVSIRSYPIPSRNLNQSKNNVILSYKQVFLIHAPFQHEMGPLLINQFLFSCIITSPQMHSKAIIEMLKDIDHELYPWTDTNYLSSYFD